MPPMGKTLVTGGAGFLGTHLVRALAERGDELRLLLRRSSRTGHLEELESSARAATSPTGAPCDGQWRGVDRVFHVAGRTSMRSQDREAVFATNVGGTRIVMEEALAAGVESVVHTSSVSAIGVGEARAGPSTRHRASRSATSASPTSTPSTRPSTRLCGLPPTGSASSSSTPPSSSAPTTRAAPRWGWSAASCWGGSPCTSTAASTSSTSVTSPRAISSPTRRGSPASATSSAAATSPSTACSPTSPGSRA